MPKLKIALTKGRIEQKTIDLLEEIGINCDFLRHKKRKLVFESPYDDYEFILVKAVDVLTYVQQGVADIGIVGSDVLYEDENEHYEMLDLEIGKCQFCVASTPSYETTDYRRKIIATKYPNTAARYFQEKGEDIEIIKIEGSVEIAPLLGLADAIVDIVETGDTLRENGLIIFEEMMPISTRLIVNRVSLKRNKQAVCQLVDQLEAHIQQKKVGV
ncbi:ATP phosphoribosyltransferase [Vagococcus sp. BWB3-3]|uniref:ATP phosphoribosyltransferase n=1 Tax=Vagococcus allomyrinae TaxID=2794353 RepID=A0A940P9P0_9ENTE|nr:ATP phosphoribosyltransferase [Vagococcus allomyrinae]MBP1044329.1 ATP phosphoribosyltransferase [Vagococcus allomyrinae]